MIPGQKHLAQTKQRHILADKKGFTLLEIMLTIVILSIGLLASANMQIRAVDTNASAIRLTEATNLAQEKLEELMALPYTQDFTDENLTDDAIVANNPEPYVDDNPANGAFDQSTESYTDWNGNGTRDSVMGSAKEEVYTDANGNGLWDSGEAYTDSNGNGIWDAAHVDPNPPSGFTITWSVLDDTPVNTAKLIRVFVSRPGDMIPTELTSIKPIQ